MTFKELLITKNKTLLQAMKLLDSTSKQFLVVVDDKTLLQGTITDGDIRRGLLKGYSLDEPIASVMNITPVIASEDNTFSNYLSIMRQHKLKQLPIVNAVKKVVDIVFYDDFATIPKRKSNLVVLMVGGLGTRLRPLTEITPKPMLPIGGKPILETIIEHFAEYGFYRFVLSVNYKKEMIKNYFQDGAAFGVEITYLEEDKRLGTAGALSLLQAQEKEPFFVMNGDLLTNVNYEQLLAFHNSNNSLGTMCVREYEYQVPYGVIKVDEHKLLSIVEKPVEKYFVNAGIYVLSPQVLSYIPNNTFYDMPELFSTLIADNESVSAFPLHEHWLDIGQLEDYERANEMYINREDYNDC